MQRIQISEDKEKLKFLKLQPNLKQEKGNYLQALHLSAEFFKQPWL